MRITPLLSATVPLVLGLHLAQAKPTPPADPNAPTVQVDPNAPLAQVASKTLTVQQLQAELDRLRQNRPTAGSTQEEREALLRTRVQRLALAQAALQAGLDQDPEVAAALERVLARKLRSDSLDPLLDKIEVTDAEVEAHYKAHLQDYQRPAQVQGAWILLKVSKFADAERKAAALKNAQAMLQEAQSTDAKAWSALAVRISEDQATRYQGGDLGWTSEDTAASAWPAPVLQAILALKQEGQVGPLVQLDEGFALVRLLGRRASQPIPLERIRGRIHNQLLQQRRDQAEHAFFQDLFKTLGVQLHPEHLDQLQPPVTERQTEEPRPPALPGP